MEHGQKHVFKIPLALDIRVKVVSVVFNPIIDRPIASAANEAQSSALSIPDVTASDLNRLGSNVVTKISS